MSTRRASVVGLLCCFAAGVPLSNATDFSAALGQVIVVGSGGCDGQDHHCKDNVAEEKVMTFLALAADGVLHKLASLPNLPGQAAWFGVKRSTSADGPNCLFVTYPGASSIAAFQWRVNELPSNVQELALEDANANPVYADVSSDGNSLIAANYHGPDDQANSTGASVQSFSISEDCHLTPADLKPHVGSSVNKDRQGAAHPHSAVAGRNNHVFVCDLGMDVIFTYSISATGKLNELARTPTAPGIGPRHSILHPTAQILFVVSEMGSTVTSYRIEPTGALTLVDTSSTLPDTDPKGYGSKAAELAMTPDGRHLYASNRAFSPGFRDTISVFDISKDGKLRQTQQIECLPFPRGMMLAPDGKFLLVASQTTGDVESFKVEPGSGHLTATHSRQRGPWGAAAFAAFPGGHAAQAVTV